MAQFKQKESFAFPRMKYCRKSSFGFFCRSIQPMKIGKCCPRQMYDVVESEEKLRRKNRIEKKMKAIQVWQKERRRKEGRKNQLFPLSFFCISCSGLEILSIGGLYWKGDQERLRRRRWRYDSIRIDIKVLRPVLSEPGRRLRYVYSHSVRSNRD